MSRKIPYTLLIITMFILTLELAAQPVKALADIRVLPTDSGYLNDQGFYHVVGEVQNVGNTTLTNINITARLYNATNEIVAEINTTTKLFNLLPGRISPFEVTLYSTVESQKVYNYTVEVAAFEATQDVPLGLEIISTSPQGGSNEYNVSGTIKNITPNDTFFTRIIATFYNFTGHAIATVANESSPSTINSSQTAPFLIVLNSSVAGQVDHYVLEAESGIAGSYYELVPEYQSLVFLGMVGLLTMFWASLLRRKTTDRHKNQETQKTRPLKPV